MTKGTRVLGDYLSSLKESGLLAETNAGGLDMKRPVNHISYDSKDVTDGTLFVCKGARFKGGYLAGAAREGAFAYVSEVRYEEEGSGLFYILVSDIRKAMAIIADIHFEEAWKRLKLVGITGTKGKSTTAYFMKHIIDDYMTSLRKPASAIISSIDTYDGVISEESHITTPEAMTLHRHFYNAAQSGIEYMTMEVSSQGLKYHRTDRLLFDAGCF
jgi:UDP-N-acetylmuramoyl-L-alanyl-D-glutamate--2,6-diaminopimelate ligase